MIITMKKNLMLIALLVCIPAVFSYANGNRVASNVTFSDVQDKIWSLAEVKNGSTVISIDRTKASKSIYTVKFQMGRLIGTGADNSCFSSYTAGEDKALSIGKIVSSRMAALYEMRTFTERDYFLSLEKTDRWDLRDGKLELHTYDKNGIRVILIFS
ncbi:MAG: META domain-containing protein [Treponema sp.]|nr:META domain-containing protein [Treponema sp.]